LDEGVAEINDLFKKYGFKYKIIQSMSDENICLFWDGGDKYIISHKGTDLGNKTAYTDITADINIAFRTNFNETFDKRLNRTKEMIKKLKENKPNCKIYGAAHSLGSSTLHHCMYSDEYIFNNIEKAYCYNAGSTPLMMTKLIKYGLGYGKKYKDKIILLHVKGDKISENSYYMEGSYRQYKLNESYLSLFLKGYRLIFFSRYYNTFRNWTQTGKYHSIDNFIM
jgi:hypothetical protein